ncbi:MAG: hypothetical protein H6985_11610 [Pseudomonadales bacterium]|nr:hypothetical protein [Halioglobus sp.]MCP5130216.1 hypothetical protein [Pseudomonadales bacterium]
MTRLPAPLTLAVLAMACFLMTGCAAIQQASAERDKLENEPLSQAVRSLGYVPQAPVEQVTDWNLYNWQAIDQHALIIWVDAFHPYLFTLRELCPALEFAQTIGVSNTGSIIDANFDAIEVPNPPGGGESCYIDKIYPLEKVAK